MSGRWSSVVVLVLLASPCAAAGFSGEQYWKAVALFEKGDRAGADTILSRWDASVFRELARGIDGWAKRASRCEDCDERKNLIKRPLLAAAILHTDRAWPPDQRPLYAELEVAYSLLKAAELAPDSPPLVRPWLLATTLRAHAAADGWLALRWAREATERYPDDARLVLAHGAVEEALCGFFSLGPRRPLETPESAEGHLKTARRLYDAALREQADLWDARLRRGRVRLLLGESGEDDLRAVVEESDDPRLASLAHLFLGRVAEAHHRGSEAIAQYRAALELCPGRTAHIALSHALSGEASPSPARRELEAAVALDAADEDPFREYPWPPGRTREADRLLAELRSRLP
jgi:hypothetical protein